MHGKTERKRHNMKNKRILTVIALCMAALTLAFAFSSCAKKTTPTQFVFDAFEATANGAAVSDLEKLLDSAAKSGELEVIFKGSDATAAFIDINELSLKSQFSGNTSLTTIALANGGKNADLKLWQTGNKMALSSSLIGDTVYGIDLEKGKDSYLASIFGKSDSEYSLISIFGENGEMFDNIKKNAELSKTIKTLAEKYEKLIVKTVDANAKTGLNNGTATIELNNESIKKIVKELYNAAKNDKELRDTIDALLSAPSIGDSGAALPDTNDDDFGDWDLGEGGVSASAPTPEEQKKWINDFFNSEDMLNESLGRLDKNDVTIVLTVTAEKKNIITKATLDVTVEGKETKEKTVAKAVLDLTDAAKKTLTLTTEESDGEGEPKKEEIVVAYNISENSKEKYSASVSVRNGDITVDNLLKIDYNKTSGEYTVSVSASGFGLGIDKIAVSGVFKYDSKSMTLTVTSVDVGVPMTLDLAVKLTAGATAPEFPETTTDLFSIDETGAEDLMNKIMTGLSDLGILGGSDIDFDFDTDTDFDFDF